MFFQEYRKLLSDQLRNCYGPANIDTLTPTVRWKCRSGFLIDESGVAYGIAAVAADTSLASLGVFVYRSVIFAICPAELYTEVIK